MADEISPTTEEVEELAKKTSKVSGLASKMGAGFSNALSSIRLGSIKSRVEMEKLEGAIKDAEAAAEKSWKANDHASARASLSEARHLKGIKARKTAFSNLAGSITGYLKGFASWAKIVTSFLDEYSRRVNEINKGQQLFLASFGRFGPDVVNYYGMQNKYIQGLRDSYRGAHTIAAQFGMEAEDVRGIMTNLAYTLRGQGLNLDKLGVSLKDRTKEMITWAKVNGVDAKVAVEELTDQLYGQGRSLDSARDEMTDMIITQNRLQKRFEKMGAATKFDAAIWREDFVPALRNVKSELPGVITQNIALGEVLGDVAVAAEEMGKTYNQKIMAMKQSSKLLTGLPKLFKITVGQDLMNEFTAAPKEFIKQMGLAPGSPEAKNMEKRLTGLFERELPTRAAQGFYKMLSGTSTGVEKIFAKWKEQGGVLVESQLKQIFGDDDETIDIFKHMIMKQEGGVQAAATKYMQMKKDGQSKADQLAAERKKAQEHMLALPGLLDKALAGPDGMVKKIKLMQAGVQELNENIVNLPWKIGTWMDTNWGMSETLAEWAHQLGVNKKEREKKMAEYELSTKGKTAMTEAEGMMKALEKKKEIEVTMVKDGKVMHGMREKVTAENLGEYLGRKSRARGLAEDDRSKIQYEVERYNNRKKKEKSSKLTSIPAKKVDKSTSISTKKMDNEGWEEVPGRFDETPSSGTGRTALRAKMTRDPVSRKVTLEIDDTDMAVATSGAMKLHQEAAGRR